MASGEPLMREECRRVHADELGDLVVRVALREQPLGARLLVRDQPPLGLERAQGHEDNGELRHQHGGNGRTHARAPAALLRLGRLDGEVTDVAHVLLAHGFHQVRVRAVQDARLDHVVVLCRRDDDDGNMLVEPADGLEHLEPVHRLHVEVEQDEVVRVARELELLDRVRPVREVREVVAVRRAEHRHHIGLEGVVVHEEDVQLQVDVR
mmetsp:Transcript_368/g.934  ORF Transcript_368/g.934 Transcript_368/m.934 type:complete len:209 (-) Transcript_368:608-1234(-)